MIQNIIVSFSLSFFRGICISHKYIYSFDYHLFHIFSRNSITSSLQCYVSYHHATYLLFRRKKNYNEINGTFPFSFPKITIHLSFVRSKFIDIDYHQIPTLEEMKPRDYRIPLLDADLSLQLMINPYKYFCITDQGKEIGKESNHHNENDERLYKP